jgi:hypothetical protein
MRDTRILIALLTLAISTSINAGALLSPADRLHSQACAEDMAHSDDPWHISNLYNCAKRDFFVPYQLWTGAEWDGNKQAPCMHPMERHSVLSRPSDQYASGDVIIRGPVEWHDDHTGETIQVWERIRPHINSHKYYACHPRGIGPIHDVNKTYDRYIKGLCRAPAGFGWQVGKRRICTKTTLEIIDVTLNEEGRLESLIADYWFRDKLKYRYTYKPGKGAVSIFRHKKK